MTRPPLRDALVAAVLTGLSWLLIAAQGPGPAGAAGDAALFLAVCAPLAWRRVAPLECLLVSLAAIMVGTTIERGADVPVTIFVAALLAAYTVGRYEPRQRARIGGAVIVGQALIAPVLSGQGIVDTAPFLLVIVGAPWVGGRLVAHHSDRAVYLAELAHELELEQAEHERLAVQAERARIAGELSSTVAHTLAELLIQAGAAAQVVANDERAAADALRRVQALGREAIAELRRMLAVLRDDPRYETGTSVQPHPSVSVTTLPPEPLY